MRIILTPVMGMFFFFGFSQPNFTKSFIGYGNDYSLGIRQSIDSSYILVGRNYVSNFPVKGFFVYHISKNGDSLQWRSYCGSESSYIENTNDSGFIITGPAIVDCISSGFLSIVKLNIFGDTLWSKNQGGAFDWPKCIKPTTDNGFVVTVYGGTNYNLLKVDSLGIAQWSKYIFMYSCEAVKQLPDSGYVIVGWTGNYLDSWAIQRTDKFGNNVWWQTYGTTGGTYIEKFSDVLILPDGNYLACGEMPNSIMKINAANGNSIYTKNYGLFYSMDYACDSNIVLAGNQAIIKIKPSNGKKIWQRNYPGAIFYSVKTTLDGGIVACGFIGQQVLVVKTDCNGNISTAVNDNQTESLNATLFPNPFSESSTLKFRNSQNKLFTLKIFTITGELIQTQTTNSNQFVVQKENKTSGLYFYELADKTFRNCGRGKFIVK